MARVRVHWPVERPAPGGPLSCSPSDLNSASKPQSHPQSWWRGQLHCSQLRTPGTQGSMQEGLPPTPTPGSPIEHYGDKGQAPTSPPSDPPEATCPFGPAHSFFSLFPQDENFTSQDNEICARGFGRFNCQHQFLNAKWEHPGRPARWVHRGVHCPRLQHRPPALHLFSTIIPPFSPGEASTVGQDLTLPNTQDAGLAGPTSQTRALRPMAQAT